MAKTKKLPQIGGLDFKNFKQVKELTDKYNKIIALSEHLHLIYMDSSFNKGKAFQETLNLGEESATNLYNLIDELDNSADGVYNDIMKLLK